MHKIALLIDEYVDNTVGGVATWTTHFMKMFPDVILIFCYDDSNVQNFRHKNIRYLHKNTLKEFKGVFRDVNIVVNSLWSTNKVILRLFGKIKIITVIHSLLFKEVITNNIGYSYISNYQEETIRNSNHIVFISKSEQEYFREQYPDIKVPTSVIYNVYVPEYYWRPYKHMDTVGYIGRFVPRKRPELAILGLEKIDRLDVPCLMMGKHDNGFWQKLNKKYDNLELIPGNFNMNAKDNFFDRVGIGSFTSIYEPFGYSMMEFIDRSIPVIVPDIDGPQEIIEGFRDCVYPYEVHQNRDKDIESYSKVLEHVLSLSPDERKSNAQKARGILERFTPEIIIKDWNELFSKYA